jgi:hypothetical protein
MRILSRAQRGVTLSRDIHPEKDAPLAALGVGLCDRYANRSTRRTGDTAYSRPAQLVGTRGEFFGITIERHFLA